MVPVCKQLLKDNVATTEGLKALVTRVNTAHDLSLLAARNINDDKVSKMHTFDCLTSAPMGPNSVIC